MKVIITVGISASGKTTWAKEYALKNKAVITNRDDLRFSLTGATNWSEYKFDKRIESLITEIQDNVILSCVDNGRDVIVADTNLNAKTRIRITDLCANMGVVVEIKTFPITLEEAWKRDALRNNGVGKDVIYKQWKQWLEFIGRKTYTPDNSLPKAVIVDIDGTLAHHNGIRKPFEWDKVGMDVVDEVVKGMVNNFASDHKIIIFSGRDSICQNDTKAWLVDNNITFDSLYMRTQGDNRKDSIIKEEMFWNNVDSKYNVVAVIDDRPQVVRMWTDIGIPKVISVADQNLEF